MFSSLVEFLLPESCIYCNKFGKYVCLSCEEEYFVKASKLCHVCKLKAEALVHKECLNKTGLDGVVVCYVYNKHIETLIGEVKYNFYKAVVKTWFELSIKHIKLDGLEIDAFVPVPLHKKKLRYRGFNQTYLFATYLSEYLGIKTDDILRRKRNTSTQVGMQREERIENLADVFDLKVESVPEKNICLVDDIMTTGTTLEECAKVLKKNKVENVYALVFARG